MFTDVGGVADQSSIAAVQTKFALLGPDPPTGLTAGPGDTILKLNWDAAAVGTVASYSFFCDPKPGTEGDGWVRHGASRRDRHDSHPYDLRCRDLLRCVLKYERRRRG